MYTRFVWVEGRLYLWKPVKPGEHTSKNLILAIEQLSRVLVMYPLYEGHEYTV